MLNIFTIIIGSTECYSTGHSIRKKVCCVRIAHDLVME
jgi:hypothetical protein